MSSAIVTGASRGFGFAVASQLAELGWRLVIDARGERELAEAAARLRAEGSPEVVEIAGDITDPAHIEDLVGAAEQQADFELLVNNASDLGPSPLQRLSVIDSKELRRVFEVNVIGPHMLIKRSLNSLRSTGGSIVNITSDAAVGGYEGWGGYGSSKAAFEQFSHVLAVEEPEVGVYWFDPGDMQTRMHQDAFPGEDISDRPLPEARAPALIAMLKSGSPSGRYTAEEFLVARTIP